MYIYNKILLKTHGNKTILWFKNQYKCIGIYFSNIVTSTRDLIKINTKHIIYVYNLIKNKNKW